MSLAEGGIDPRTLRAVTEYMTVIEEARALFEVTTQSGSAYMVDLQEPACTCYDFQYREHVTECKHIRRVRMEMGQVDIEALEAQLTSAATDLEAQAEELTKTAAAIRTACARLTERREKNAARTQEARGIVEKK